MKNKQRQLGLELRDAYGRSPKIEKLQEVEKRAKFFLSCCAMLTWVGQVVLGGAS